MPNRLAAETSPYLRQHADNPVDWWPWSDDALAPRARQNKPILLSIGYAACHWCHVMAHESFEDAATARVDERAVRQHQGRSRGASRHRQGLSARAPGARATRRRLAADGVPDAGRSAAVLRRHVFSENAALRHAGVRAGARRRARAGSTRNPTKCARRTTRLRVSSPNTAAAKRMPMRSTTRPIRIALDRIAAAFDRENGGHLGGPKFPHASEIELLLRAHKGRRRIQHFAGQHGAPHARAHGRARTHRSSRRRFLPLLRRRALGNPALREDAVRQRAAAAAVRARRR